jgi:hypothetical protein
MEQAFAFLDEHEGHVLILAGSKPTDAYKAWVRAGLLDADVIRFPGANGRRGQPVAWLEYREVGEDLVRILRRVVLAVSHPRAFGFKTQSDEGKRVMGFMERLLDLGSIFAGEVPSKPALLTSRNQLSKPLHGRAIPLHDFLFADKGPLDRI